MLNKFLELIRRVRIKFAKLLKKDPLTLEEKQAHAYFKHLLGQHHQNRLSLVHNQRGELGICIKNKKLKVVSNIFTSSSKERTKLLFEYFNKN